jgi:hypothetical protein
MSASKGSLVQKTVVVPAPATTYAILLQPPPPRHPNANPAPSCSRGQSTKLGATPDGKSISYGSGKTAVIRPVFEEDGIAPRLFGHAHNVLVCKPISAYYAASGDAAGNLKVRS